MRVGVRRPQHHTHTNTHLGGAPVAGLLTKHTVERYRGIGSARSGYRQREEVRHCRPTLVLQRARRRRRLRLLREIELCPVSEERFQMREVLFMDSLTLTMFQKYRCTKI